MKLSRHRTLGLGLSTLAALGATALVAPSAFAQNGGDTYDTDAGPITIHPVSHASLVIETPSGVIYVDPVGEPALYESYPNPDLVLLTHEHGDHFDEETLAGLIGEATAFITNPAVLALLPEDMAGRAQALANGETGDFEGIGIEAVPAYNTTEDRLQFHPQGRDNGYVLDIGGSRVYIAGDTEDIPEMRALQDIDIAFVPMNLPFTMTEEQAASAVAEFAPGTVYPYHYGESDLDLFEELLAGQTDAVTVVRGAWY